MSKHIKVDNNHPELNYDYFSRYYEYDEITGRVKHRKIEEKDLPKGYKRSLEFYNRKAGNYADNCTCKMGDTSYRLVHFQYKGDGCRLYAHKLAWLFIYKKWPVGHIDHLNGNGVDNSKKNLRDCGKTTHNMRNKKPETSQKKPVGVRFTLSGKAKTPTFKALYRSDCGKD